MMRGVLPVTLSLPCLFTLLLNLAVCRADAGVERAEPPPGKGQGQATVDMACGPRCVRFVLRDFGHTAPSVSELVQEMQAPVIDRGCSLEDIRHALASRGVAVKAVRLNLKQPIEWPTPVILHLKPQTDAAGHFVVWLPSSKGENVRIWNGLLGVQETLWPIFSERLSGAALLTLAPDQPAEPALARDSSWSRLDVILMISGIVSLSLFLGAFWRARTV